MTIEANVIAIVILATIIAHVALLWMRGSIIASTRRDTTKAQADIMDLQRWRDEVKAKEREKEDLETMKTWNKLKIK